MWNLPEFTRDSLKAKVSEVTAEYQSVGWDDTIMFMREHSANTQEEALATLLTPSDIVDLYRGRAWVPAKKIECSGVGTSFGGIMESPYPELMHLYALNKSNHVSDQDLAQVTALMSFNTIEDAASYAQEVIDQLEDPPPPPVRVTQVTLIPVSYQDVDEEAEEI